MECCQAPAQTNVQLAVLLVTGFTLSLGHCSGMCGPIAVAYGVRQRETGTGHGGFSRALAWYHIGRLSAYIGIGTVLAGLSQIGIHFTESARGGISLAAGVGMGLSVAGSSRRLPSALRFPRAWVHGSSCGRLLGASTMTKQIGLGIANGLLPCGPVAAVALAATGAAAAGAVWHAGLSMLAYGLGTLPVLTAIASGASWAGTRTRARLNRIGVLLLMAVSIQLILRGAASLGWIDHLHIGGVVLW